MSGTELNVLAAGDGRMALWVSRFVDKRTYTALKKAGDGEVVSTDEAKDFAKTLGQWSGILKKVYTGGLDTSVVTNSQEYKNIVSVLKGSSDVKRVADHFYKLTGGIVAEEFGTLKKLFLSGSDEENEFEVGEKLIKNNLNKEFSDFKASLKPRFEKLSTDTGKVQDDRGIAYELLKLRKEDQNLPSQVLSMADEDVFDRDSSTGELFVTLKGDKVYVDDPTRSRGPDNAHKYAEYLIGKGKCFATGLAADNEADGCRNAVRECILGKKGNLTTCVSALSKLKPVRASDFDNKSLPPTMAIKLLQTLGFKKSGDSVESVDSWSKRTEKDTKLDKPENQNAFIAYLKAVVDYVNNSENNFFLNKNVNRNGEPVRRAAGSSDSDFAKLGIRPYSGKKLTSPMGMLKVFNATNIGNIRFGGVGIPLGQVGGMIGGGVVCTDVLEKAFNKLQNVLKAKNKTLDEGSVTSIKNQFATLKDNERKLNSLVNVMTAYTSLLGAVGDNATENIDEDKMNRFVRKQESVMNKINNSTITIADILLALEKLAGSDNVSGLTEITL